MGIVQDIKIWPYFSVIKERERESLGVTKEEWMKRWMWNDPEISGSNRRTHKLKIVHLRNESDRGAEIKWDLKVVREEF